MTESYTLSSKIRRLLERILVLGGSPCSGKSTIAGRLADRHGLRHYRIDDDQSRHLALADPEEQPVMTRLRSMSWDAIWMRPVTRQVEEEFAFYRERMTFILRDLERFDPEETVLLEGAAMLPDLVRGLGVPPDRALYLVPEKEFQLRHYARRPFIRGILSECSDPDTAFANWMERDHRFGARIREAAAQGGYRVITVDGSRTIGENIRLVERHFGL